MAFDNFQPVKELIDQAKSVLIVTHYNPDADAFGSSLGLGLTLEKLGKKVYYYDRDPAPFSVRDLPFEGRFSQSLPQEKVDLCCILDANIPKRISEDFESFSAFKKLAVLDHHEGYNDHAHAAVVIPEKSSTSEVIFDLIQFAGWDLSKEAASCLYAGLIYDTGSFKHRNTTSSCFQMASTLAKKGIDCTGLARMVFAGFPFARLKLYKMFLDTVEKKGAWACGTLTLEMLKKTGANYDMADGFVNQVLNIEGVEVATLFRQDAPGKTKISLRSQKESMLDIAKVFHGGGHKLACGAHIDSDPEQAKEKFIKEFENLYPQILNESSGVS